MRSITMAAAMSLAVAGCSQEAQAPAPTASSSATAPAATAPSAPASAPTESAATASPTATAAEPFPARFQALGTEPFWSLAVDGTTAKYSTPDNIAGESSATIRNEAGGTLTVTGSLAAGTMRLTVTRETCSDGMSDTVYPFTAKLTIANTALSGCARPGVPRPSP